MSAESAAKAHVSDFRWWVGSPDVSDPIAHLRDLAALRDAVNSAIDDWGVAARERGESWTAIGGACGFTRQAATQRFAPLMKLF